jgi:hypothetical protein
MVGLGVYHELTVESEIRQRLAWIPLLVIFLYVVSTGEIVPGCVALSCYFVLASAVTGQWK